jgi:hypothetical protein
MCSGDRCPKRLRFTIDQIGGMMGARGAAKAGRDASVARLAPLSGSQLAAFQGWQGELEGEMSDSDLCASGIDFDAPATFHKIVAELALPSRFSVTRHRTQRPGVATPRR